MRAITKSQPGDTRSVPRARLRRVAFRFFAGPLAIWMEFEVPPTAAPCLEVVR